MASPGSRAALACLLALAQVGVAYAQDSAGAGDSGERAVTPVPGPTPPPSPSEVLSRHAGWKLAGLALSISLTRQASAYDERTSAWARAERPVGDLARVGDLAPSLTLAGITGTLAGLSLTGPKKSRRRHARALESLVVSQLIGAGITDLLKAAVARPRPDTGAPTSFPSGHTASAAGMATLLWRRYGWSAGVPASLLALLVGFSRIQDGRHYLSDVLAGAILGVSVTYVVDVLYGR